MIATPNRKAVRRLALRSLKSNPLRNVTAVIAILLTTLLITAVFSMAFNLNESMQYTQMRTVGTDMHGGFKYLQPDEVEKLKKHPSVREYAVSLNVGDLVNKELAGSPVEVKRVDEAYAKHGFIDFIEGGLPEAKNEVALNTWVLNKLGTLPRLGEPVRLTIQAGKRTVTEEFVLSGYYEADKHLAIAGLAFVSKRFTDDFFAGYVPPTSIDADTNINTTELSVMFNNSFNIEQKLKLVLADTGIDAPIGVNWAYSSVSLEENWMNYVPYAGVVLIIMLSGYLLIYNIFYISVVRDVKFYGLLKTIGTTPKQLRRIISMQALLLYACSLPFGLAAGYGAGRWLTPLAASIGDGSMKLSYSASPYLFGGAALFSFLTVAIAAGKPGRIAARVAPVEAVKFAGVSEGGGRRKTKRSKRGAALPAMAFSNLFRSRKKLTLMLASLSLSIVLFSIIFTVISSLDVNKYLSSFITGDLMVTDDTIRHSSNYPDPNAGGLSEEVYRTLRETAGVTRADRVYYKPEYYPLDEQIRGVLEQLVNLPEPDPWLVTTLKGQGGKEPGININLYGVDPGWYELLEKDVVEGQFDREKFESGGYVLLTYTMLGEDNEITYYHPGDKITYPGLNQTYEVMAVLKYNAMYAGTTQFFFSNGYNAFFPASQLEQIPASAKPAPHLLSVTVDADSASLDQVKQTAVALTDSKEGLLVKTRQDYREELGGFIRVFQTIGYGLSLVIALIGVVNYINSVLTGVVTRRNEFAVLESVGMTRRQMKRMLTYEGLFTVLLTAVLTSTAGAFITYWISNKVTGVMEFTVFRMQWLPFIAAPPMLALIAYGVTLGAYQMLTRATIVERLRETE